MTKSARNNCKKYHILRNKLVNFTHVTKTKDMIHNINKKSNICNVANKTFILSLTRAT